MPSLYIIPAVVCIFTTSFAASHPAKRDTGPFEVSAVAPNSQFDGAQVQVEASFVIANVTQNNNVLSGEIDDNHGLQTDVGTGCLTADIGNGLQAMLANGSSDCVSQALYFSLYQGFLSINGTYDRFCLYTGTPPSPSPDSATAAFITWMEDLQEINENPDGCPEFSIRARLQLSGSNLLTAITKYTALGDSVSAGVGAGTERTDGARASTCRRFDHSHPSRIDQGVTKPRNYVFEYLSCSGAKAPQILAGVDGGDGNSQIDQMTGSSTVTTLSIGGNDVGFFAVLNACVYRFQTDLSGDCATELAKTGTTITSQGFHDSLDTIISGIFRKAPLTQLYVTGYARFWNENTTQCNDIVFCFWRLDAGCQAEEKLRQNKRQAINNLAQALNGALSDAVDRANVNRQSGWATFFDPDELYEGHRFCEEGVTEPDPSNGNVWFYQDSGAAGDPGEIVGPIDPTPIWDEVDFSTCLSPAEASGDWQQLAQCYAANAFQANSSNTGNYDLDAWGIPNKWVRMFHPKVLAHQAIAAQLRTLIPA